MTTEATTRSDVADHYARGGLVAAIRDGLARMGKTESTVTAEDLAPVDEFHIGGRASTETSRGSSRSPPTIACSTSAAASAVPRATSLTTTVAM